MIKINTAEFIKGIVGTDPILRDGLPQIAFVGRSNVGKSSVINTLAGKRDLVRAGKKPGKTKIINFFKINNKFYFVDLPGYGYAKAGMDERERIRKLILWYLEKPEAKPSNVILIIDINVGLTELDLEMMDILHEYGHRYFVVANKADKLTRSDVLKRLEIIKKESGEGDIIPYSAKTKQGSDILRNKISDILSLD